VRGHPVPGRAAEADRERGPWAPRIDAGQRHDLARGRRTRPGAALWAASSPAGAGKRRGRDHASHQGPYGEAGRRLARAAARPGHKTVYSYTDEAGTPVFEVERQGAAGGRGKKFLQRHTAADGAVVWKLPPAGRGLVYHLPAVKRAIKNQDLVVVVEGEKDADRLTSLNLCATCNAGGASASSRHSKWTPRHAAHLSGAARVVVIPDADAAGLAHAASVARSLAGKVERVQVVDIAAFGHVQGRGDDVSNWLDTPAHDADHNLEALTAILNDASDYQPHQPATAAETEHPPPPRTRLNRMQSTPVGCADQLLRAHGETLLVVTDAGAPTTVRVLDANAGTWGDGFDVLGSWLREMCEQHASAGRPRVRARSDAGRSTKRK
jgi:5S rRNA maturation endonuclease (ribonuclease M5)